MDFKPHLQTLQDLEVEYALYYQVNGTEPVYHANCKRFMSASLIKVPILLAWLYLERMGEVKREETCDLDAEPQVHGAGFAHLFACRRLPFQDVLVMMIATSDNLCTNLVIQRIGIPRLNQVFKQQLGLAGTELQRLLMDFAARQRGLDNWITAQDCILLYKLVDELGAPERTWVDSLLLHCQDSNLLGRDLERDSILFFHKTGSIPGLLHDWGYTDNKRLFLLTQNVKDELTVTRLFGEIGRISLC